MHLRFATDQKSIYSSLILHYKETSETIKFSSKESNCWVAILTTSTDLVMIMWRLTQYLKASIERLDIWGHRKEYTTPCIFRVLFAYLTLWEAKTSANDLKPVTKDYPVCTKWKPVFEIAYKEPHKSHRLTD